MDPFFWNYVLEKGLEEDLLPMPNFTERRDKDRAIVPPMSLAVPATMAVVVPRHPGCRTLSSGASPLHHCCPRHRPGCCCLPSNLSPLPSPLPPSRLPVLLPATLAHPCRHHHHPLHCHRHPSPATIVAVTIALATIAIASLLPATLITVTIALATLTLALFVTRQPRHHCHHPRRRRHHCHRPCCRQSPATLVAIALAAKAIALFVTLHTCCQRHHPLHPPHPLRHPPPLSPPSPSLCRPHPLRHMLPLLVDCFFFTFIVGWAVSQLVSQHAMI
jgi:hypothetical protein